MGLGKEEIQTRMVERSKENLAFMQNLKGNQEGNSDQSEMKIEI
jgi:hypothetical protein